MHTALVGVCIRVISIKLCCVIIIFLKWLMTRKCYNIPMAFSFSPYYQCTAYHNFCIQFIIHIIKYMIMYTCIPAFNSSLTLQSNKHAVNMMDPASLNIYKSELLWASDKVFSWYMWFLPFWYTYWPGILTVMLNVIIPIPVVPLPPPCGGFMVHRDHECCFRPRASLQALRLGAPHGIAT